MPGPSSGVEGSTDGDLRPKEGILLAMADSVPGMPMLALLLRGVGRPAAQCASLSHQSWQRGIHPCVIMAASLCIIGAHMLKPCSAECCNGAVTPWQFLHSQKGYMHGTQGTKSTLTWSQAICRPRRP